MDLSLLEQRLVDDPDDLQSWAVYADALLEADSRSVRARAISAGLRGEPFDPDASGLGPPHAPHAADVSWRFGFWRAVRLRSQGRPIRPEWLHRLLGHPAARFLGHLVAPMGSVDDSVRVPPSLGRLDLVGEGTLDALASIGSALAGLHTLAVSGHVGSVAALPAPGLRRLSLGSVEALALLRSPSIEVLELGTFEPDDLLALAAEPDALPALRTLALRDPLTAVQLDALVRSPAGLRLRQLEVVGGGLTAASPAIPRGWLRALWLDDDEGQGQGPGTHVRVRHEWQEDPSEYVRLAVGAGLPVQAAAFEAAAADLGIRTSESGLVFASWIAVPEGIARSLCARMAAVSGWPAEHLVVEDREEGQHWWGRVELACRAIRVQPDGSALPVEIDLTRKPRVQEVEHDYDEDTSDYDSGPEDLFLDVEMLREELWDEMAPWSEALWLPVDWRPDPFELVRPAAVQPRALVRGGAERILSEPLARYVAWRVRWVPLLEQVEPPDLERWTQRLLVRHRLTAEPPAGHPYWEEWSVRTRAERVRPASDPTRVPSFKLLAPGRWLLSAEEGARLAAMLESPVPFHRVPEPVSDELTALVAFLSAGEAEVTVR